MVKHVVNINAQIESAFEELETLERLDGESCAYVCIQMLQRLVKDGWEGAVRNGVMFSAFETRDPESKREGLERFGNLFRLYRENLGVDKVPTDGPGLFESPDVCTYLGRSDTDINACYVRRCGSCRHAEFLEQTVDTITLHCGAGSDTRVQVCPEFEELRIKEEENG